MEPEDIAISVDFKLWNNQQQFYELRVRTPDDILEWMDLSPQQIELVVTKRVG